MLFVRYMLLTIKIILLLNMYFVKFKITSIRFSGFFHFLCFALHTLHSSTHETPSYKMRTLKLQFKGFFIVNYIFAYLRSNLRFKAPYSVAQQYAHLFYLLGFSLRRGVSSSIRIHFFVLCMFSPVFSFCFSPPHYL